MLTVAIIGAGKISGGYDQSKLNQNGRGVFTHAGAYRKSGKYILETVCDLDEHRATAFQLHWGFARTLRSVEEIYSIFHDVVSICTPDETHYSIIKSLIGAKCCKCIFVEKPIAQTLEQIQEIIELAAANKIAIIVNFQRRFDSVLADIREKLTDGLSNLLAANAYYIKGLDHIGTTMLDTITYILGYPNSLLAFNKIYNQQVQDDTYEFVLFYTNFNITVKTVDSNQDEYNYHIFELDFLTRNERFCINDNSRQIEIRGLTNYAYSGVRILDDHSLTRIQTEYDISMIQTMSYIYGVVTGVVTHTINTPEHSYNVKLTIDKIKQSYKTKEIIDIKVDEWKK